MVQEPFKKTPSAPSPSAFNFLPSPPPSVPAREWEAYLGCLGIACQKPQFYHFWMHFVGPDFLEVLVQDYRCRSREGGGVDKAKVKKEKHKLTFECLAVMH